MGFALLLGFIGQDHVVGEGWGRWGRLGGRRGSRTGGGGAKGGGLRGRLAVGLEIGWASGVWRARRNYERTNKGESETGDGQTIVASPLVRASRNELREGKG